MDGGVSDREQADDILSITGEFLVPVGEGEHDCPNSSVPGDCPVSSVLDDFGRFNCSKRHFDVPKLLDLKIVVGGRELAAEDRIEIDSSS
jgi:hypothetical protein